MNESMPSSDPGTQKRRSARIVQAVPVTVTGVDALGQPFKERTATVSVNCHGCKYQSKHYVPKNSTITLEIPRLDPAIPPRLLPGRVIWVERPRTVRELFQIGLEFDFSGNVWGVAFPPEDWFPCPGEEGRGLPAAEPSSAQQKSSVPNPAGPGAESPGAASAKPAAPNGPSAETRIFVVPDSAPSQDAELPSALPMAKMIAQADASAAAQRWKEEFEAVLSGASQTLGRKLSEVSQTALTQIERDIAARGSNLRESLEDVIFSAEGMIQSLGTRLEQERARAEGAQTQLEEMAAAALEADSPPHG